MGLTCTEHLFLQACQKYSVSSYIFITFSDALSPFLHKRAKCQKKGVFLLYRNLEAQASQHSQQYRLLKLISI